jgi:hypothetical protein
MIDLLKFKVMSQTFNQINELEIFDLIYDICLRSKNSYCEDSCIAARKYRIVPYIAGW